MYIDLYTYDEPEISPQLIIIHKFILFSGYNITLM